MNTNHEQTIRVAIIEDHDDLREGLVRILREMHGIECVGAYWSVENALGQMKESDIVLLDIGLPGMSGIEGIPVIKAKHPRTQIIMLTVFEDEEKIFQSVMAGANGYLLKKTSPAQLLQAMKDAVSGGMPMTSLVARQVINHLKRFVPSEQGSSPLTPREAEILVLLAEGLNYPSIAERLFISLDTVRNHIRHIYEKLQVHSKAQAVAKAMKQGFL